MIKSTMKVSLQPLVGTIVLWATALIVAAPAGALDLYVATSGQDTQAGTAAKPFATLERAREEVRRLKQQAGPPRGGITVWVGEGDYLRTNALELTSADSGTPEGPIIWRAETGKEVRLLGGRRLTGFERVTDSQVLARLPEPARGQVWQVDLRKLGITDFGDMKSRGFSRPGAPAHCELFYHGKPMTLARWPNEGQWDQIAAVPEATSEKDEHGGTLGKLSEGFFYSGDRPRAWKDVSEVWVHGYWAWDWANSYERVLSIDLERHLVKTVPPGGVYGFRKGQRFYFLNVLEELDKPGEWYLDRQAALVYFWPPTAPQDAQPASPASPARSSTNDTPTGKTLLSLLTQPLLRLADVSNVTFRGFTIEATRGDAVQIHGGSSNRIAGCRICNIGDTGVTIDGGLGHSVVSCDIFDTGDGGVSLSGGDRQTLAPAGHYVDNCHFARQGRWSKCYVPAILMNGVGMRASHNLIEQHPHCAILFNGNDHLIEFNEIHHIALETGDVGAIYTGRDYTYRGNRIRHNFIHHTGGVGMGSMGVYMDDCVSGTEIFGNIFYKVQRAAFLGGGCDHQVSNNIFVDCNHAVELDGRGLDTSPVWHDMVDQTMRKGLAGVPLDLYRQHYPAMKELDEYYGPPAGPVIQGAAFKGVPPVNNLVARNVCVGKWLNVYWHATTNMLRLENNFVTTNPHFVGHPSDSARPADFGFQPDSPAWKLGFKEIPLLEIGLHQDELRTALPGSTR